MNTPGVRDGRVHASGPGASPAATRRLALYVDLRDWWVGVFIDVDHLYICVVPCVVLRWARKSKSCAKKGSLGETDA